MAKYRKFTDFVIGDRVFFIHNNMVRYSTVDKIIVDVEKVEGKKIDTITYRVKLDNKDILINQNKLFKTADDLKEYLSDPSKFKRAYAKEYIDGMDESNSPNLAKSGFSLGDTCFLMYNDEIHKAPVKKIKITNLQLTTGNVNTITWGVEYVFEIKETEYILTDDYVYGSKASLLKALFDI